MTLQKKIVTENRRKNENVAAPVPVPDLTDFMNDMFFGTVDIKDKKEYNLTGSGDDQDVDFDYSTRSNSSRLTHEWLEEARRMVASSPGRSESPTKLIGSPCRFATTKARLSSSSSFDHRRDPLSRSARRHRAVEGSFSGEIMTKSAKHSRNKSSASLDLSTPPSSEESPAAAVHKWFSNMLKPTPNTPHSSTSPPDQTAHVLPPRQSIQRKSRFQTDNTVPQPHPIPPPNSRRTFRTTPTSTQVLSPPKNYLTESGHTHRRSNSYSTLTEPLSPPKILMESAHRRSISKSTCSLDYKVSRPKPNLSGCFNEDDATPDLGRDLNGFLKDQRIKIDKISNRELDFKAKIVLPAPTNSTSSMVAAVCYAWLLENRVWKNKGSEEGDRERYTVVPVMNVRRGKMWNHQQTAWLFNHLGLDATSLLFADEVDLESLIMAGKLSILVVGQDVLRTTGEVGSQCTILTDNYCEDAYDLLQTPMLKKLLLAGILLDTQNLDSAAAFSVTRDAEAVQLLLVGSSPNYRNALFDQLTQDERDSLFTEALKSNYGNTPNGPENREQLEHRVSERRHSNSLSHNEAVKQNSVKTPINDGRKGKNNKISPKIVQATAAPAAAQAVPDNSRGKNKFSLAKWFGFGSK
ncbi:hypothetical protein Ddye_002220 [Dipteronia dyeriana]|uniref:Exopolyphosphatase n=1 Tax=Dipteronia dyeriana TaxID=168575 RepID=A0AAD9XPX4_9ROSI|nr:hypothetical protein Ddye_002220 [Dipteronia dyeriana]